MIRESLSTIRKELDELDEMFSEKVEATQTVPNHGKSWTIWDKEFVIDRFNELIDKTALKMGRTKLSIILFISRHISRGCR